MFEIWKVIKDYPTYAVSNKGRVLNLRRNKLVKPSLKSTGHLHTKLFKNNTRYHTSVHRLVLTTFRPHADKSLFACHIDGNPSNNYLSNLYWGSAKENTADWYRHTGGFVGEKHPRARITQETVRLLREEYVKGVGITILARKYQLTVANVASVVYRQTWKHVLS